MGHRKKSKRSKAKTILRLPDLEQSKYAVLHSLAAASSQESYGHAIDEFIAGTVPKFRLSRRQNIAVRLPSKTHSKCKRRPATEESSRREHAKAECLSTNCELIY